MAYANFSIFSSPLTDDQIQLARGVLYCRGVDPYRPSSDDVYRVLCELIAERDRARAELAGLHAACLTH